MNPVGVILLVIFILAMIVGLSITVATEHDELFDAIVEGERFSNVARETWACPPMVPLSRIDMDKDNPQRMWLVNARSVSWIGFISERLGAPGKEGGTAVVAGGVSNAVQQSPLVVWQMMARAERACAEATLERGEKIEQGVGDAGRLTSPPSP